MLVILKVCVTKGVSVESHLKCMYVCVGGGHMITYFAVNFKLFQLIQLKRKI